MSSFGVQERPNIKKGNQTQVILLFQGIIIQRGQVLPKKGNDRNAKRNKKLCGKCGCLHGG